jgi:hypothetical protein
MGTVQVMTVYRCCSRAEDIEVETDEENNENKESQIVKQLPVIETESNESFATTIPCHLNHPPVLCVG